MNACNFLPTGQDKAWQGTLICDDDSGCKAMFELRMTEAGCLAHARREFHELRHPQLPGRCQDQY